ncbi:MAG TPA: carboxymuconolactone decarboxylase family protein [Burkholderiaceae bacterium]
MSLTARIALHKQAPAHLKALLNLAGVVKQGSLGPRLVEMVNLRVSQINGCGFCADMHWRDLLKQEVDPRHLNAISVWREAPFFTDRERAALRWAELLNAIPHSDLSDAEFAAASAHFSEQEMVELGYTVATIRAWNLLSVSLRNPIPQVPAPGM